MSKLKFSANLGFLWKELFLPDAIRAAKKNGFDAVECHWPYKTPTNTIIDALNDTKLTMLSLNTIRGDVSKGELGLCALPGRQEDAHTAIDQALQYATQINCPFVHVMAGNAHGQQAHQVFIENLTYASTTAKPLGITLLIEPLNPMDASGYFLNSASQATDLIAAVGTDNIKLLFDCYHIALVHKNLAQIFDECKPLIGHIQIASVPGRQAPNLGTLDYAEVFSNIAASNYEGFIGAEYKPTGVTEDSLAWMHDSALFPS